jgi:ABC-type uncharacterized transport system permease subunit
MPADIHVSQFLFLLLTVALFGAAFVCGLRHMHKTAGTPLMAPPPSSPSVGPAARILIALGTLADLALLLWRAASENKLSLPLSNHFDAFLVLALLLAVLLAYFRWTKNLRALAFFLLPMIIIILLLGGTLALLSPNAYPYDSIWTRIHIVTVIAGTVCFALGCVGGVVFLIAHRQLKHKTKAATARWMGLPPPPSLGTIEKFNRLMIYLGFPLLTIAMVTGILRLAQDPDLFHMALLTKIALAILAWMIYALLLSPFLAPRIRGPRAAWLWIIGFALLLGGYMAARSSGGA